MKSMKTRIAQCKRRMKNRRAAQRQIQFDIQGESKKFLSRQSRRLRDIEERRLTGERAHKLRKRKDRDNTHDEESVKIRKDIDNFEHEQRRKLSNLLEEEAQFKKRLEVEHQQDLKGYARQIKEEYEEWEESYRSSEYDTDCFPLIHLMTMNLMKNLRMRTSTNKTNLRRIASIARWNDRGDTSNC